MFHIFPCSNWLSDPTFYAETSKFMLTALCNKLDVRGERSREHNNLYTASQTLRKNVLVTIDTQIYSAPTRCDEKL
jgi:hypothetical protein